MTSVPTISPEDERRRLLECAREPIRTPGAIQPHGALLGMNRRTHVIEVAGDNSAEVLGLSIPPLGMLLDEVLGVDFARIVREYTSAPTPPASPLTLANADGSFDVIVHEVDQLVILEFEPVLPRTLQQTTSALYALIQRLSHSADMQALLDGTARELRALTGFDRVMVYHFHPDGHGEVVAEHRAEDMEPYLGLHFPASDIPVQARQLYLTKLSRAIVGTSFDTVDLLTLDGSPTVGGFDLSRAELRSVSPHHLQFMRNMGQDSTLSFSMVREGELIGMITCAHRSHLRVPFILRRGIEVLANQVALQLMAVEQLDRLRRQATVRTIRADFMTQLNGADDFTESFIRGRLTALDVISADGVAVRIDGTVRAGGHVPPRAELDVLVQRLSDLAVGGMFASAALSVEHPDLSELAPSVTGVLVVRIGGAGDYLAFFRDELLREVNWLGDQTVANRDTALSPRNSFSSWTASVERTAAPWEDMLVEGVELGRDVESALLRRIETELAHLALRDSLTGLPNRRGLMEQLQLALDDTAREHLSVLFIDLDDFKRVNDEYGHEVGDAVLQAVGRRIQSATRATDTVARLGGDEFVVVCDDIDDDDAVTVADRVRAAIADPIRLQGLPHRVAASVGCASVDTDVSAAEVLRAADQAMYRAKQSGRDRSSR